jgi:23S rRNA pseudouridine1911/1915/1917 synthase
MTKEAPSAVIKLSSPEINQFWPIPVLFEDEHLLALDKPAGLLSSPDRAAPDRPSLVRLLHTAIAQDKPWARERSLSYLMNSHRLDGEISGVLLFAKSKPVFLKLADFFGSPNSARHYLALAKGNPPEDQFEIEVKMEPDRAWPGSMRINQRGGKRSHTRFEVQERFSDYVLLRCEPLTDRPHQIRLHLRHAGIPLVGDSRYGGKPLLLSRLKTNYHLKPHQTERPLLDRPALHAQQFSLAHPVTGEPLTIVSPWPKDLTVAIKYLRRYALIEA